MKRRLPSKGRLDFDFLFFSQMVQFCRRGFAVVGLAVGQKTGLQLCREDESKTCS